MNSNIEKLKQALLTPMRLLSEPEQVFRQQQALPIPEKDLKNTLEISKKIWNP